ncbi:MAG TPA: family 20 glycosylhydrolase [Labilithrix sp.]|nr:family 20 glycosylhydrolase [Labilithrix sp.]
MCQAGPWWHVRPIVLILWLLAGCAGPSRPAVDRRPSARHDGGGALADAGPAPLVDPSAAALALIPTPRSATRRAGSLALDGTTQIVVDDDPAARAVALRLAQWLDVPASSVLAIPAGAPGPARAIVLRLEAGSAAPRDPAVEPPRDLEDESYSLDVTPALAVLRARHPAGLFYGAQTIAQLASSRPLLPAPPPALASATADTTFGSPTAIAPPVPVRELLAAAAPRMPRILPCVHIEDGPAYRVRVLHLDVARHFFSKELVERYVDILSFYRFNVFHWHLTDDQGFRLAIRSHPELTQIGGKRVEEGKEYAGWYTQDQAREVVAFAKDRFVTVVPEIEMPGHARAILAAHPELSCTGKKQEVPATWGVFDDVLCAGNERTFTLLADVLRETTEVFPSRLIHVGGDEVPKTRWNACPKCRARMKKEQLSAEQLQGAFMKRAGEMLAASGRRMMAWDEALDGGLARDGVVVAWRGVPRAREAAVAGHDVVLAPYESTYFNFWQSRSRTEPGHSGYLPWTKVLGFDVQPGGLDATQAAHVLGGEGALWTEYVRTVDDLDTLLLPRLAALSETLWRVPPPARDRPDAADQASFVARFLVQRRMLDASGVRYFVEPPAGLRAKKLLLDEAPLTLAAPSLHPDGIIRFTLDGTEPDARSPVYSEPVILHAATSVAARLFLPGGRASDVVRGTFEATKLHPNIQPSIEPESLREGVLYKYFEGDFRKLPDFARLAPLRRGRLAFLSLDPGFRAERFAVVYDAWLRVPEDGIYRLVAKADDGVTVDIDGVRVLDDDGEHAAREADGEIALARGPHTVRVGYFQGTGGKELLLRCEGPGLPPGPCVLVSP